MSSVKGKIIEWVIVVKEIPICTRNRMRTQIGYGSSRVRDGSAETNRAADTKSLAEANCADTIRGRLLIEGGNYSRKYGTLYPQATALHPLPSPPPPLPLPSPPPNFHNTLSKSCLTCLPLLHSHLSPSPRHGNIALATRWAPPQ